LITEALGAVCPVCAVPIVNAILRYCGSADIVMP